MAWWLFVDRSEAHNAQLNMAGNWAAEFAGMRGYAANAVPPSGLPPGWYEGNVPVSGDIVMPPKSYLTNRGEQSLLNLNAIGPTNEDPARASALQAALAASLKELQ